MGDSLTWCWCSSDTCVWPAGFTGGDQQNLGDDYNLNENEAEPEREKQAALAGDDRNLSVLNAEAQKRGIIDLPDGGEKRSHILNEVGVHVPQQA